jgi:PhzF family phenazine biosynthesis protein
MFWWDHKGVDMKFWYVDAFTDQPFKGNPAGVFIVDDFPESIDMQTIAAELNLSETTYVKKIKDNHFHIRWFSPKDEAPLCGHATIAASHVLKTEKMITSDHITFDSKAGELSVRCDEAIGYELNFPEKEIVPCELLDTLRKALGDVNIQSVYKDDLVYLVVLDHAEAVQNLKPNLNKILKIDCRAVIVTAQGPSPEIDFVSRYFAPSVGIPEDPVCGSAHCRLTPFWAKRLNKLKMTAYQSSKRTGYLAVTWCPDEKRVLISGKAYTVGDANLRLDIKKKYNIAA